MFFGSHANLWCPPSQAHPPIHCPYCLSVCLCVHVFACAQSLITEKSMVHAWEREREPHIQLDVTSEPDGRPAWIMMAMPHSWVLSLHLVSLRQSDPHRTVQSIPPGQVTRLISCRTRHTDSHTLAHGWPERGEGGKGPFFPEGGVEVQGMDGWEGEREESVKTFGWMRVLG